MPSSVARPLVGATLILMSWSGVGAARASERCLQPGDFYPRRVSGLAVVDLGPVKVVQGGLPDGTAVPLEVSPCGDGRRLAVVVPWSEKGASPPASIHLREVCPPGLPVKLSIDFQVSVKSATWVAIGPSGLPVDTQTTPSTGAPQTVTLSSASGIREVLIQAAELCISQVCYSCEDSPPCANPIRPSDFFGAPVSGLAVAAMGPVTATAAVLPGGAPALLSIGDCTGDGVLDLVIPWSQASALRPAMLHLRGACEEGQVPVKLEITFVQGVSPVTWRAFDALNNPVDVEATVLQHVPQTVALESPAGIARVEIDGAELCILSCCYTCGPTPPPPCEKPIRPSDFFGAPASGLAAAAMGPVTAEAAVLPGGAPALLSIDDCSQDGLLDLVIPWSQANALRPATLHLRRACERDQVVVRLEIAFIQHVPAVVWRAFDALNNSVDVETTVLQHVSQTVALESPAGIARVEIDGAELCLMSFCIACGPRPPRGFVRGDSNTDGRVNLSDAIHSFSFLFLGDVAPPLCRDASDANDDGKLNIADPTSILGFAFQGDGPLPGGRDCNLDIGVDDLDCLEPVCP